MLPRWHILLGAIFTLIIWIAAPQISFFYLGLLFLSSFLIDLDHYIVSYLRTGKFGLRYSFEYHKKVGARQRAEIAKGIKKKGDFHFFHTLEFHILIAILGIYFAGFFFIFVGMLFHSLLDIIWMLKTGMFHTREFFLFRWVWEKITN